MSTSTRTQSHKSNVLTLPTPARRDHRAHAGDQREIAASADRIDMIIAVFAIGVLFGLWIA